MSEGFHGDLGALEQASAGVNEHNDPVDGKKVKEIDCDRSASASRLLHRLLQFRRAQRRAG
ncbi:hypothetical protein GCM10029964_056780 [Kibdelosporangium lantanae]